MRLSTTAVVVGLAASLAACARPGNTPAGTPTAESHTETLWASLAPAQPGGIAVRPSRLPLSPAIACDGRRAGAPQRAGSAPAPQPSPNPSSDADDRARRALEAANPPIPRRGPLPDEDAAVAEACVRTLRMELTLLTAARGEPPDESSLRRTLTRTGLSGVTIGADSRFAASTGKACVYGTFASGETVLSIGPRAGDGTCRL